MARGGMYTAFVIWGGNILVLFLSVERWLFCLIKFYWLLTPLRYFAVLATLSISLPFISNKCSAAYPLTRYGRLPYVATDATTFSSIGLFYACHRSTFTNVFLSVANICSRYFSLLTSFLPKLCSEILELAWEMLIPRFLLYSLGRPFPSLTIYLRPLSYFYYCFLVRCWYSAAKRIDYSGIITNKHTYANQLTCYLLSNIGFPISRKGHLKAD